MKYSHTHPLRTADAVSEHAIEKAARLFRAIGDAPRLKLLAVLARGEACVSELAGEEQLSTVSQRLRVLRAENIVSRHRDGKHIYYTLADRHIASLVENALEHAEEPVHPRSAAKGPVKKLVNRRS